MMSKVVAILQSNYIPWKGYFDIINKCDKFVLLDDVQFTKNDWRNRNRIKTPNGIKWITIPVVTSGKFGQLINSTRTMGNDWRIRHWDTICNSYSNTPGFQLYGSIFKKLYNSWDERNLSLINRAFIETINSILSIKTDIFWSTEFPVEKGKTNRLVAICRQLGATSYLSGPAARGYLDVAMFAAENITVEWMDYSGYPPYSQLNGDFVHEVSVLDLIFNTGKEAPNYMLSFKK